jgi:hypothetical protein
MAYHRKGFRGDCAAQYAAQAMPDDRHWPDSRAIFSTRHPTSHLASRAADVERCRPSDNRAAQVSLTRARGDPGSFARVRMTQKSSNRAKPASSLLPY